MKIFASIGTCRICGQGRLLIARENASGKLYVLCEDCESEWQSPHDSRDIEKASRNHFGQSTFLSRDELIGHPWETFLS